MPISVRQAVTATALVAGIAAVSMHQAHYAAQAAGAKRAAPYTTWSDYEGNADSAQYSAQKQINKTNVSQLRQVWFYPAGDNHSGTSLAKAHN